MTNPIDGLNSLQSALNEGLALKTCALHPELQMIFDQPNGCKRFTYAMIESGVIKAYATLILGQPLQGKACFSIGYATSQSFQSIGLASEVLEKSIDELKNSLRLNDINAFYIEAVIRADNAASLKVASKVICNTPRSVVDELSGEDSFYYQRLID